MESGRQTRAECLWLNGRGGLEPAPRQPPSRLASPASGPEGDPQMAQGSKGQDLWPTLGWGSVISRTIRWSFKGPRIAHSVLKAFPVPHVPHRSREFTCFPRVWHLLPVVTKTQAPFATSAPWVMGAPHHTDTNCSHQVCLHCLCRPGGLSSTGSDAERPWRTLTSGSAPSLPAPGPSALPYTVGHVSVIAPNKLIKWGKWA